MYELHWFMVTEDFWFIIINTTTTIINLMWLKKVFSAAGENLMTRNLPCAIVQNDLGKQQKVNVCSDFLLENTVFLILISWL